MKVLVIIALVLAIIVLLPFACAAISITLECLKDWLKKRGN